MNKQNMFKKMCSHTSSSLKSSIASLNQENVNLKCINITANIVKFAYDKLKIEEISDELTDITNQKPLICRAKKSVAALSIRAGAPVSLIVTLRGENMYFFLEKCLKYIFPKLRDFQGYSLNSCDKKGNLTFLIKDRFIFSEIKYNEFDLKRGYIINLTTNTKNNYKSYLYLKKIGIPFLEKK